MTFKPKFFYESGGANEGGGNATETLEENKTGEQQQITQPFISAEEAKTYGFDSPDALKEFLAKRNEENIPPEVIKAKENEEKANFLKFAAEQKDEKGVPILNVDEFNQYETLKAKADKDLVFDKFMVDFKADHPEIDDEEELEEAAIADFNAEYKLADGLSEAAKKKGEAKLAREAKELREPFEKKVSAAQEQFKQNNNLRETYPKFDKFVDTLIEKNTPNKLGIAKVKVGQNEIPIEIELTEAEQKEMRASMAKSFKTPKAFKAFIDSKPEDVEKTLDNKMQGWLFLNKKAEITQKIFDSGTNVGKTRGSNVGANNPFPLLKQSAAINTGTDKTLEQSNAELAELRKQYISTH